MNLPVLLFLTAVGWVAWSTWRSLRRAEGPEERALVVRGVVLFWLLAGIFVAALVFLPNKGRVLALIPIVLVGGAAANAYRASRRQLREKAEGARRFAAAKRVN
jgi:hypothetical protein